MEIAPCFTNKKVCQTEQLLLSCCFFLLSSGPKSPTSGRIIRAVTNKGSDCLLRKHSHGCGGWPPVEEALEGIPVLGVGGS